jgi:hypothetical protein
MLLTIIVMFVLVQCLVIFRKRFNAERKRQIIITRPRVRARLGGSTLVKHQQETEDKEEAFAAKLVHSYSYYQQAEKFWGSDIAPGGMTLSPRQRDKLEAELVKHEELYAFVDPQKKEDVVLTPGPELFSLSYLGKVMAVCLGLVAISWVVGEAFISVVVLYLSFIILMYQVKGHYPKGLHNWLDLIGPTNVAKKEAGPQVQGEVMETMELRELADNPLKVED